MAIQTAYGNAPFQAWSGTVNDLGDGATDIRCALLDSTHTPDTDTNTLWSDISANEVTGDGYTTGGAEVPTTSLSNDNLGTTTFSGDDIVWSNSTITARYAAIYEAGSGTLITLIDFEAEESSENGDFTVELVTGEIFTHTT